MPKFEAQAGPQSAFLRTSADLAIYGGAAGGGKTWALLVDDLYHIRNPRYRSLTFRRVSPQITQPGGLWDEAAQIYPHVGGKPNRNLLEWRFPSGAVAKFAHMQYEDTKHNYQGGQITVVKFDELTHFSEAQFFYMVSRSRSMSGIRSYLRGSCNADADSWVAAFIAWWIDQETGFPIPARAGKVRWFVRPGGELLWADTAGELPWVEAEIDGRMVPQPPMSVTFIPAKVTDNKALLAANPQYLTGLLSLPPVDRARLLDGNWKIRVAAGAYFKRHWFPIVEARPANARRVRYWDLAATEPSVRNRDPDWTRGVLMSKPLAGGFFIEDIRSVRGTPGAVEALIRQTAAVDGRGVAIRIEQEPGSSGKTVIASFVKALPGYDIQGVRSTGSKEERAKPVSSQAEVGNIALLAGAWNGPFLDEAEAFPDGPHDDQIDAASGALAHLAVPKQSGTAVSVPTTIPTFTPR